MRTYLYYAFVFFILFSLHPSAHAFFINLGFNAGYINVHGRVCATSDGLPASLSDGHISAHGITGGIQLQVAEKLKDDWLVGLHTGANYNKAEDNFKDVTGGAFPMMRKITIQNKDHFEIGVVFGRYYRDILLYVNPNLVIGQWMLKSKTANVSGIADVSTCKYLIGGQIAAGIEVPYNDCWSFGTKASYTYFEKLKLKHEDVGTYKINPQSSQLVLYTSFKI